MTKLIIVRHGESEANKLGVIAGHNDYLLTALGRKQADETAAHLANEQIDAVYASDLARAMETAEPHAAMRGLSVIPSRELRETFCGDWEGVSFAYVKANAPAAYATMSTDFFRFTLPNGESVAHSGRRFLREILRIAKAHEGKTVLVAAHGAVIRCFWALMCNTPLAEATEKHPYASNSSYSIAYYDGEKLIPGEYSCDSHLTSVTHLHI